MKEEDNKVKEYIEDIKKDVNIFVDNLINSTKKALEEVSFEEDDDYLFIVDENEIIKAMLLNIEPSKLFNIIDENGDSYMVKYFTMRNLYKRLYEIIKDKRR